MKLYLKKLSRIILILVCTVASCNAQNDYINHKKYWYYKTRFNNDFVLIGTEAGMSIPFNRRGNSGSSALFDPGQSLNSGDASAQLGCYLGVLATEYKLLKNNGQDLTKIKHEIFCALNAVNRIDYVAEAIFNENPAGGNLNGFFVRDDIPKDFAKKNYNHFNYYQPLHGLQGPRDANGYPNGPYPSNITVQMQDKGFTQTFDWGMAFTGGSSLDYITDRSVGKTKDEAVEGNEESHDQAYYLLMGLSLVSKLVDDVPDGNSQFCCGVGEVKLQSEAKNIAGRIINHFKSDEFWRLRNPANGDAFVKIGKVGTPYAYAMDNLGCFIKYGEDLPAFSLYFSEIYPYNACDDFSNLFSRTPLASGPLGWHGIASIDGGIKMDEMGFFHCLAGAANCVYDAANAQNLIFQAGVDAAQAVLNSLWDAYYAAVQNYLDSLNVPQWVKDTAEWVLNAVNGLWALSENLIDGAQAVYNHYQHAISVGALLNTTDYHLYNNTKFKTVDYFSECNPANVGTFPNTSFYAPIPHTGTDLYFGTYLKDALRIGNPAPNLPNWLIFIKDALYNLDRNLLNNDMVNILNSAPCDGNYNYDPTNLPGLHGNPGPNWGCHNRLDRPDRLWRLGCYQDVGQGDLAGLDYLLLHNLYYLTEGTGSYPISNYSERTVPFNFPTPNQVFSSTDKRTFGAFETISTDKTIASNGAVDFRAGKEIIFLPGFSAEQGSDFSAVINPYDGTCNNPEMSRQNNSGNNDDGFFDGGNYSSNPVKSNPVKSGYTKSEYDPNLAEEFKSQLENQIKANNLSDVNFDLAAQEIYVYPNPNNGDFNIDFNLKGQTTVNVFIYDVIGKKVFEYNHASGILNLQISLKELNKGIYIIKFIDQKGFERVKRLTIQ